jgi:hypothetical protein
MSGEGSRVGDSDSGAETTRPQVDRYAAGTPGGGTASGGLAGTNYGDGSPDDVDLEDAMGSGIHDADEEEGGPPFSGRSGGAVGGTPAQGRASEGHRRHGGLRPGGSHRGDSTIGSKD